MATSTSLLVIALQTQTYMPKLPTQDNEYRYRLQARAPDRGLGRALTYRKLKQIVRELRHDAACAADSLTAH